MHVEITTSLIGGVALVMSALITSILAPFLISIRKHAKTAAEQTKNSHTENLRDDVDLMIVSLHSLHHALGVENTLVKERAARIRQRRSTP